MNLVIQRTTAYSVWLFLIILNNYNFSRSVLKIFCCVQGYLVPYRSSAGRINPD